MDLKFGGATYSTMQQITGHIFHMDFFLHRTFWCFTDVDWPMVLSFYERLV